MAQRTRVAAGAALTTALTLPLLALSGSSGVAATGNVNVTGGGAYVRVDGGHDATIDRCSTDNRAQNESSLAVDPTDSHYLVAGANDYCTAPFGDAWEGIYTSSDSGKTWTLSLIPGYTGDTSSQGQSSPLQGFVTAAGDPWNGFDRHGHLFAMGNGFNRAKPENGSVWLSSYLRDADAPTGYRFLRTVILDKGTPGSGISNDKTAFTVDNASARYDGNVYAAYSQFHGTAGGNEIDVVVSRDHGRTFSPPVKVSDSIPSNQDPDLAVASDGSVYLVWRQAASHLSKSQGVAWVVSHDGGATWSKPRLVTAYPPYIKYDQTGDSTAAALRASASDGIDDEASSGTLTRDCGDGASACKSGYTFYRDNSQPRLASDANGVYLVFNEEENLHKTGTSFLYGGYSRVRLFTLTGGQWVDRGLVDDATADGQHVGHQTFPTVSADGSAIHVGWIDSRVDSCFDQDRPSGNCAGGAVPPTGSVTAWAATVSETTYQTVDSRQIAGATWNPNWEQFSGRTVPFYGDYITMASGDGATYFDWTDNRDVAAADVSDGDGDGGGNDVAGDPKAGGSCADVISTCFDGTHGLDQNIYVAQLG